MSSTHPVNHSGSPGKAGKNGKNGKNGKSRSSGRTRSSSSAGSVRAEAYPSEKQRPHVLALVFTILGVFLVLAIAAIAWMSSRLRPFEDYDLIMPNVYIDGIDVGGMTRDEAVSVLNDEVQPASAYTITVVLPDRSLEFGVDGDNITLDITSTVNTAYYYGRGTGDSSAWQYYQAYQAARKTRKDLELTASTTLDEDEIRAEIDEAAAAAEQALVQSSVTADQQNGILTVTPGTPGISLNADQLYEEVCNAIAGGTDQTITSDYETTQPDEISLDEYYDEMTIEPVNASYDPETAVVTPGTDGREPEVSLEDAEQQLAAAAPGDTLTFRFDTVQPEVQAEELEALLFRDVVTAYASVYDASNPGRTENLRLACEAINGTVVLPGKTFSFNDTVGERTAEKGYQEATVYVSGNSVDELGGGVCQVASTIYYCCMYADLEIVEREPHMYFVTYVPGGLDATVYWGQVDFQFRNSTDYPIRIDAWLEDGKCWIQLVGTDSGNYAEIVTNCIATNPFATVYKDGVGDDVSGYTGYTYEITRYIYDSNGTLIRTDTPDALGSLGTSKYSRRDKIVYSGVEPAATATTEPETETETEPEESPSPTAEPEPSPSAEAEPSPSADADGADAETE